jgi:hypothetical protein
LGTGLQHRDGDGRIAWIRERMVNSRPSGGGEDGRLYWIAGGCEALAGFGSRLARFVRGGSLLATALPVAAAPTAKALLAEP